MYSVVASVLLVTLIASAGVAHVQGQEQTWYSACGIAHPVDAPLTTRPVSLSTPSLTWPEDHPSTRYDWSVTEGYQPGCQAYGFYNENMTTTGWTYLHIESNEEVDSKDIQFYAAGYLEGALSHLQIYQTWVDSISATFQDDTPGTTLNITVPPIVYAYVHEQTKWILEQYQNHGNDSYWQQVYHNYVQVQGIADGAASMSPPAQLLSYDQMLIINLLGELPDIILATNVTERDLKDRMKMTKYPREGHCSALIRLAPDLSDLWSTHTTWTQYGTMLRTYKYYAISDAHAIHFSSYPGCISSIDDFYTTSNGLTVIETTNSVANMTLYDYVHPQAVPTFVRVMVANQLAEDGAAWSQIFSQYNSGTYNNQWMIVNYQLFTPGQPLVPNTLWICSQIPGRVESSDVTSVLIAQGYWSSYNIAYYPDLWATLGYQSLIDTTPTNTTLGTDLGEYLYSYENSFRAVMFKRDAPKVNSTKDMKQLIQQNNWQTDPLSRGNPQLAIASRMDLSDGPLSDQSTFGAADGKLVSYSMVMSQLQSVYAKSGPTVQNQAPFNWSSPLWNSQPHLGMPDVYDFDWQTFTVATSPQSKKRQQKQQMKEDTIEIAME